MAYQKMKKSKPDQATVNLVPEEKTEKVGVYDLAKHYAGAGAKILGYSRTREEIDAHIRSLRDDD